MDTVQIIACFSLIVAGGKFEDLNELAWLVASQMQSVQVFLTEYPTGNGWRLQIVAVAEDDYQKAYSLVEQCIAVGASVTIANGLQHMPTRLYTTSSTQ